MIPPALTARYALQGFWYVLALAVIVFSLGFGLYHKILIDGYKFLFFESEGYRPAYERVLADNKRILEAQEEAERLQRMVNEGVEQDSAQAAERIDDESETELARQLRVANEYIRRNSVRQGADRCSSSTPVAATEDHSAGSGEAARTTPFVDGSANFVMVLPEDINICTVNTIQAEAGRKFALEVEALTAPKN